MKYIIVSFKVKNTLYSFVKFLKSNNIQTNIVNTPRNISTSCGLSAKINIVHYNFVVNLIKNKNIPNIIGLYIVERFGNQEQIQKVF